MDFMDVLGFTRTRSWYHAKKYVQFLHHHIEEVHLFHHAVGLLSNKGIYEAVERNMMLFKSKRYIIELYECLFYKY